MNQGNDNGGERFTGHGPEWRDSNLSPEDARTATAWVEQVINKRSMEVNKDRVEDVRDEMWQLEKEGEIVVHRVGDEHQPRVAKTIYGWDKKIPTTQLWHHKSCGQCGNIPGYPASLLWLMNEMDITYLDETDQTSCTAWNYHGSGIGNIESLAAVFLRNFHQAYVSARAQGLPDGYFYPLVHCGTSFGNYKEVRGYLVQSAKLRERVRKILGKLGRLVDGKLLIPEEVVHYSEWLHVMRDEIAKRQVIDASHIRATVHPACHVYKMVPEDAVPEPDPEPGDEDEDADDESGPKAAAKSETKAEPQIVKPAPWAKPEESSRIQGADPQGRVGKFGADGRFHQWLAGRRTAVFKPHPVVGDGQVQVIVLIDHVHLDPLGAGVLAHVAQSLLQHPENGQLHPSVETG